MLQILVTSPEQLAAIERQNADRKAFCEQLQEKWELEKAELKRQKRAKKNAPRKR